MSRGQRLAVGRGEGRRQRGKRKVEGKGRRIKGEMVVKGRRRGRNNEGSKESRWKRNREGKTTEWHSGEWRQVSREGRREGKE